MPEKIEKSDQEWRDSLTAEQYRITRRKGTEPAFTGEYEHHEGDGVYRCVCCGAPLFDSGDKYDSGSGWPSFTRPIEGERVAAAEALGYSFNVPVGRRVAVTVAHDAAAAGEIFVDLFRVSPLKLERVTGASPGRGSEPLVVDVIEGGDYVLRVQPRHIERHSRLSVAGTCSRAGRARASLRGVFTGMVAGRMLAHPGQDHE